MKYQSVNMYLETVIARSDTVDALMLARDLARSQLFAHNRRILEPYYVKKLNAALAYAVPFCSLVDDVLCALSPDHEAVSVPPSSGRIRRKTGIVFGKPEQRPVVMDVRALLEHADSGLALQLADSIVCEVNDKRTADYRRFQLPKHLRNKLLKAGACLRETRSALDDLVCEMYQQDWATGLYMAASRLRNMSVGYRNYFSIPDDSPLGKMLRDCQKG